jgi:NAD(P)-dependent dehydrogenase (short-subunit alcohol dehydrogenase family)
MGAAIARRQGGGKKLVLADFNPGALSALAASLTDEGFDVHAHVVDVSSRPSVDKLVAYTAGLGRVVNVAHTAGLSPVQASAEAVLAVDLVGVGNVLDAFGEVIEEGGAGVVISSMAGAMAGDLMPSEMAKALRSTPTAELLDLPFWGRPPFDDAGHAYSIAKRANHLQVQAASLTWGARGARVNSISPGVTATPMGQAELLSERGRGMRAMVDASGTGRVGTPSDIAEAAAFLLSPSSSFITGTDLLVDGGVVAAFRSGTIDR